jgi:hypothetical protein
VTETVAASVDDADLLAEVSAWLDEHWDPELTVAQWWDLVGRAGWTAPDGPVDGRYAEALVFAAASSIYGGTDQIQRNVIGERALGLPREPDPNKGLPFREVQTRVHGDGHS